MPSLEFSVLGRLDIRSAAAPIRLTRPMSRGLLALLLARSNRCVPTGQLIDELWKGEPPSSAEGALRVHISHLRDALGTTGDRERDSPVQHGNGGYWVTVEPGAFDVDRFEAALREGRTALQHGAPGEATDLLGRALRLWRGRAYDEFGDLEPIRLEATRLAELRLDAVELLAEAHLAVDRPGSACELLAPEVRAHPFEERLVERLMLALYRSGRAPEALRVASRLREALDDELGVLPRPGVRELEDRIVVQAPDLDAPRRRATHEPDVVTRSTPFVGRRVEARALDRAWTRARDGASTIALIQGGAGIGKTALADQLVQRARQEGAAVLVGHCDPDPHTDYEPFPHLVRQALGSLSDDDLGAPVLGELRRLVPDLSDRLPPLPESATVAAGRHRLFVAVNLLLERCDAPVLVVVEDLHWARRDALALLRHVVREHGSPMMVVATYRDDEVDAERALGRALASGPLADPDVRIGLGGLDVTEIKALLELLGFDDLRRMDLDELADLTSGNPLFVREVVRALGDAPDASLDELAPDGVRTLVGHQLQRLTPSARDILTVAALLGARFSLSLLAATARTSETGALAGVDEALATRLLVETDELDSFTFGHTIVRNVIYASIPASRRARLHLRAGEILAVSAGDGRWAEPARHFLAARPLAPPEQAARYARSAGDDAAARFAHDEAADWYRAALESAANGAIGEDERAGMLLALGMALERGGDREAARRTYLEAADAASVAGDDDLLADIAIAATPRYATVDAFHATHRELVDRALAGAPDETRRARLFNCAAVNRYYDDGEADRPYVAQALLLARESDTPEVQASALQTYHRWLTHDPGAAAERAAMCRELLDLCTREELHVRLGAASRDLLVNLLSLGRLEEFDRELDHLDEVAVAHDIPADRYWASALRATRGLMQTADAETEGLVRAAHTLGARLQQTDGEGTFILHMFTLRWQQDRTREITKGLAAPPPDQPSMEAGLALLAGAFVAGGRADDAREVLDRVLAGDAIGFPKDNMWLAATALVGGVAAAVGSPAQRAVCHDALADLAELWCVFGAGGAVFGTVHHWLGLLAAADGDRVRAGEHLERARDLAAGVAATYWADRAQAELDRCSGSPAGADG